MAEDEQANEMEALAAIFDADFTVTSDSMPRSFELLVVPNSSGEDNHIAARLYVDMPAEYPLSPEHPLRVRVRNEKGLTERYLGELNSVIEETVRTAAESGEVASYLVAEAVRTYLADPTRNVPALSMHAQMAARMEAKISEEDEALERRRLMEERIAEKKKEPSPLGIEPGTLLTPESFAHWRALFDAEQRTIAAAKEASKPRSDRLTGKQLFLQNLARELGDAEADTLEEEDPEVARAAAEASGKQIFFMDESLFLDDDEEDEDGEGEESDEEDDMAGMFDTTTDAQKQMQGSASAAAAPKLAAASSSSSAFASSASAAAPSAARPAASAARPSSGMPPGFSSGFSSSSSSSARPAAAPSSSSSSSSSSSAAAASAYAAAAGYPSKADKEKEKEKEKSKKGDEPRVMTQSERDKMNANKAAQAKAKARGGQAPPPKGKKK